MTKNDLIHESSPYLLQHSDNPVHWFPWNEKSLNKAATENKPILLSIGYSACHWCHVMAHESFEDPNIAKIMNQFFINIKIDREERPDIDQIYQTAHQILTQRTGGWPLTMFLDPLNHRPFLGAPIFPMNPVMACRASLIFWCVLPIITKNNKMTLRLKEKNSIKSSLIFCQLQKWISIK